MKRIEVNRDRTSVPLWLREMSDTIVSIQMLADTTKVYTIPTGANMAIFQASADFFVSTSNIVAPPQAGVWGTEKIELSPPGIIFEEGDTDLCFFARGITDIVVSFYA